METHRHVRRTSSTSPAIFEERSIMRTMSPGAIVAAVVGAVVFVFGVATLVRTGVGSDVTQPTTNILGITHSAGIGIAEVIAGLLLVISSLDLTSAVIAGVIGALAVIAGVIGLFATAELQHDIGFDVSTAWFFVVWGAIALFAAFMPVITRSERVDVEV